MDTKPNATTDRQASAKPRFQRAERRQIEWRPLSLDQMLPDDHPARLVWAYVESLDLSELYQAIRAVEGHVGRDPIDPKILVALWPYATIDGVGSAQPRVVCPERSPKCSASNFRRRVPSEHAVRARRLDRLCTEHIAFQWLCGGVSVNDHALSDFRVGHVEFLDRLLTQSVSTLSHQGLIELNRVAQDGMRTHGAIVLNGCSDLRRPNTIRAFRTFNRRLRMRASTGSGSFRRRPTLEECLTEAESQLVALKQELEQDPSAKELLAKQRTATAEFPHAGCRNRGLLRFLVRGRAKAKAVGLWQALAHNFQRTLSLRAAASLDMV